MRKFTLLITLTILLVACAEEAPPPTGPTYLGSTPEFWAKAITGTDMRMQEVYLNRLALGREDVIPVLIALLAYEDPEVVEGAYMALDANLGRVEDKKPWVPALEAATKAADPDVRKMAEEALSEINTE